MDLNDVVSIGEIPDIVGLSLSTIQSYSYTGYGGFPKPVTRRGNMRLWSKKELEEWAKNR